MYAWMDVWKEISVLQAYLCIEDHGTVALGSSWMRAKRLACGKHCGARPVLMTESGTTRPPSISTKLGG